METKYYLYIKTSPMGLKYLGKTIKDPFTYIGSGKIWQRHLKKHNLTINDITTEIIFETYDLDELARKGLEYSKLFNVVESDDWANLRDETGDGGDTSKFIDYTNPIFHKSDRSKHLNEWISDVSDEERQRVYRERSSKIDFDARDKKTKENTNWEAWRESVRNRKLDYSKFLWKTHEKNKKPVLQYDLDDNFIQEFDSAASAARSLGAKNGGNISKCCKGGCKTTLGYKWKYKVINNENK
jgi:hypothetical protein